LSGGRHVGGLYQAAALQCPLTDPLGFIKVSRWILPELAHWADPA